MLSEDPNLAVNVMPSLLFGAKTIQGILGAGSREMAQELATFMETHQIHPPIAQTFAFEQADQALSALEQLTSPGKIVVKV
ncbi:hypothetical protein Slin14017_G112420 [Septoria linicola]|nr:hypothetical protein Slin14017_G112420 [Septoria linicola]